MNKRTKTALSLAMAFVLAFSGILAVGTIKAKADQWAAPAFVITDANSTYADYKIKYDKSNSGNTDTIAITNNHSSTVAIKVSVGLAEADSYSTVDTAYTRFKAGFSSDNKKELSPSEYNYFEGVVTAGSTSTFEMVTKTLPSGTYASWVFSIEITSADGCPHEWKDGVCTICGKVCDHSKLTSRVGEKASDTNSKTHTVYYDCAICGKQEIKTEEVEHTIVYDASSGIHYSDTTHPVKCKYCNYPFTEGDCTFNRTVIEKYNGNYHQKATACQYCNNVKKSYGKSGYTYVAHKVKNNKCTICGAKIIKPGNTKITSVSKGKASSKKVYAKAHYDAAGKWHPSGYSTAYYYPVTVKFKKAKNAKKYLITYAKPVRTLSEPWGNEVTKKTSIKLTNPTMGVKSSKLTIYITPVSKTGTYGKTVKKTIKL